jgi:hypothetical protein
MLCKGWVFQNDNTVDCNNIFICTKVIGAPKSRFKKSKAFSFGSIDSELALKYGKM